MGEQVLHSMESVHGVNGRICVVALMDANLPRPEAPLGICGPFGSREEAEALIARWSCPPGVSLQIGYMPRPEDFERHMAGEGTERDRHDG